jgi:hypothetical protein
MNEKFMAMEDQLEIMEVNFTESYVEYLDPIELELHNEKEKEVHREIPDESMDESVIYFEEVKEFEFESFEYLDNSSPHPPPEEPISLKEKLDNLEENSAMVPLTCSFSTSQPKEDFMKNYEEMEGNSMDLNYSTRGSSPCTMKICIIKCYQVRDFLVLQGNFCHHHIFL